MAIESGDAVWIAEWDGIVHDFSSHAAVAKVVSSKLHSSLPTSQLPVAPSVTFDTVVSVEFVAKPNQAAKIRDSLSAGIAATFETTPNFAGCAVMVSEQEQRLVTVLTFWRGASARSLPPESARWVSKLLDPYMDRKLRVQTMRSQVAIMPVAMPAGRADSHRIHVA